MVSTDSTTEEYDALEIVVVAEGGTAISGTYVANTDPRGQWYPLRLPIAGITSYRGQEIALFIRGSTDSAYPTTWYVDYVWLVFACGSTTAGAQAAPLPGAVETGTELSGALDSGTARRREEVRSVPSRPPSPTRRGGRG